MLAVRAAVAIACLAGALHAAASPENAILIIDPTSADSLQVGNHYRAARDLPDANVIYMAPSAPDYPTFADRNLDALAGALAERGVGDHIDFVIVTPGSPFYTPIASGVITDGCFAVRRISISGAYTLAHVAGSVLAGGPSTQTNQYYRSGDDARAFDSHERWLGGSPTLSLSGERYYIGAMLGYSGANGNTVAETLAMIDRSVAIDGMRPGGTFYFMQTGDVARSGPRHPYFPAAVAAIAALGGAAQHLMAVLPTGQLDCLGIMTGAASPGIATASIGILPGAFCDHLTSFAGRFDTTSQEKMSLWIGRGASGTWGTVEEPCNYAGKFPHARMHVFYYQGLSLGEATLRSVGYRPYQGLLYGDPLTRPFATIPTVKLPDVPLLPVAGTITLSPSARTLHPTASIARHELLIDGVLHSIAVDSRKLRRFTVDTTALSDGHHELRVLSTDSTPVQTTGRWLGELTVDNHGRSATLGVNPASGDRTTAFTFDAAASGGVVTEVRLLQGGRVVAAAPGAMGLIPVFGETLGAGSVQVQAEALFGDGERVRSAPVTLDVLPAAGTPLGLPPVAFDHTRFTRADQPFLLTLPATSDDPVASLVFNVVAPPAQSTIAAGQSGPALLARPQPGAAGMDSCLFEVVSPGGISNLATVTIVYQDDPGTPPFAAITTRATVRDGGLPELLASDDRRLVLDAEKFSVIAGASTSTELEGTAPVRRPSAIRFELEAMASPGVDQQIELFDWLLGQWITLDTRPAAPADALAAIDITASPERYVDPPTRRMRARIRFRNSGPAPLPYSAAIDLARWRVTE